MVHFYLYLTRIEMKTLTLQKFCFLLYSNDTVLVNILPKLFHSKLIVMSVRPAIYCITLVDVQKHGITMSKIPWCLLLVFLKQKVVPCYNSSMHLALL